MIMSKRENEMKEWMVIEIERENKYISTMERINNVRKTKENHESNDDNDVDDIILWYKHNTIRMLT